MSELILHHFDLSPFAEKARLILGLKGLAWRSVQIPMIMPKPDLMPLTGGYRKTPVLQIGADIFCDTSLIARRLEDYQPQPTLFPNGGSGLAYALGHWSDKAFFEPGAALSMGENPDIPEPVLSDRKAFFNFMDFDRLQDDIPHCYAQLRSHALFIDQELSDGRRFLTGDQPGLVDIQAYFPVWMSLGNFEGARRIFEPMTWLVAWQARMAMLGHGDRHELESDRALEIARAAEPLPGGGVDIADPLGFEPGQTVVVAPDDYGKVPVTGELFILNPHEVAIKREEHRVGTVAVHFPRIGYRIEAA